MNSEEYEDHLEKRCKEMLQDFGRDLIYSKMDGKTSLRDLNNFIDEFMWKHNLLREKPKNL